MWAKHELSYMLEFNSSLIQLLKFRHLIPGCEQLVPSPAVPAERKAACDLPLQHMGLMHVNKYQYELQNSAELRTTIQKEGTI